MITNEVEYIEIEGVPYKKTTYYDETEGGEKREVASVTEPVQQEQPKEPEPTELHLTREDFDLLDVTYATTTYHILEEDNTITIQRGEF